MADKQVFIDAGPERPKLPHSNFDISYVNNLTARFGRVYPVYCRELPAGSRLTIKPSMAFDMMPLVYPIQTNVRAHLKFYKIPMRILCNKFEDFYSSVGADGLPNNSSAQPYVMPYIKRQNWCGVGSLAEYFGVCNQVYTDALNVSRSMVSRHVTKEMIVLDTRNLNMNLVQAPGATSYFTLFTFDLVVKSPISNFSAISNAFTFYVVRDNQFYQAVDGNNTQIYQDSVEYESLLPLRYNSYSGDLGIRISSSPTQVGELYVYPCVFYVRETVGTQIRDLIAGLISANIGFRLALLFNPPVYGLLNDFYGWGSDMLSGTVTPTTVDDKEVQAVSILGSPKPSFLLGFSNFKFDTDVVVDSNSQVFDSVNGSEPLQPINALPFRAYEFIHNYFFRNERVAPFTLNGVPKYNEFITNDDDGADETTPLDFFNALYEYDYFTTCVKEPQFGKAPLVGVTVNDLSDTGILTFQGESSDDSYVVKIPIGENGAALPLTVYKGTADDTTIHRLNELISFGISVNDLRNVSSFQRMLERYQRSGHKYQNVVYEFFGTNPPIGDHYPTYLGGFNANMSVQKITNMALSRDAKLGEFAGQGRVSGKGRKIRCFCSEPCYVIGLLYFSVTPTYSQYLPKHFIKSELLDYLVNPDFATLSPQPVYKKELAPTQVAVNPSSFNAVFGYQRPYADYVASFDEAHGLFKTSLSNFLLQRKFLIPPSLNRSFIEIRSSDLLNIFSVVEDEDKLYGQVYFDARVSLPLPRSYSPRSI